MRAEKTIGELVKEQKEREAAEASAKAKNTVPIIQGTPAVVRKKETKEIATNEKGVFKLAEKVKRDVFMPMPEKELIETAKQAGIIYGELSKLELELNDFAEKIKPKIKEKRTALDELNALMYKGKKKATVLCNVMKDYDAKEVLYYYPDFNGEIVERRLLTDQDKQMHIGEEKK